MALQADRDVLQEQRNQELFNLYCINIFELLFKTAIYLVSVVPIVDFMPNFYDHVCQDRFDGTKDKNCYD